MTMQSILGKHAVQAVELFCNIAAVSKKTMSLLMCDEMGEAICASPVVLEIAHVTADVFLDDDFWSCC